MIELVEEKLTVGDVTLSLARPADPESLLDEELFARDEFLPYWAELWPSSRSLAEVVAGLELAGRAVLELGCGLGLPSLVAAARSARVVASDWSGDAIATVARNAEANGLTISAVRADWREPGALGGERVDLVLAADVLYEARNAGPLLAAIDRMLMRRGEAYVVDPGRRHAARFAGNARELGWQVDSSRAPLLARGALHVLRRAR